jgi:N-acetylglucosaminyltransferase
MRVPLTGLTVVLPPYLTIALAYARWQRRFAHAGLQLAEAAPPEPRRSWPSVDVIIPCYNEKPPLLAACLRSLRQQDYQGKMNVWIVDDGSDNRRALLPVLRSDTVPTWRVLRFDGNRGKREAQDAALHAGRGSIVVTIDSDTIIASDGISRIVAPFRNPRVGAVTGNLRASNATANWLTRLIDTRYGLLFERERAAQGFFGTVLCCAGPFSAYRRKALKQIWKRYIDQVFWGRLRVFGDDLALTNLVLAAGYLSVYEPAAKAFTSVPTTVASFARQQLRWNRSFYRELPQMVRLLPGRSGYLALDLAARTLLPALLAVGLAATAADALLKPARAPWDVGALALMALASVALGPSPARSAGCRFAVRYGIVFVGLLLPTRCWAACTLFQNRWGTRDRPGHLRMRARSLTALRSAISLPFSLYSQIARSSSRAASP